MNTQPISTMKTNASLTKTTWLQHMAGHVRTACAANLRPLLLLLLLPAAVQAQYTYTTDNGTITITGYTGPGGDVTIPSTVNGLPVTSIGNYAFYNNTSMTSVTIPDSVTYIGYSAFWDCFSLTSVRIGYGFTNNFRDAFSGSTNLIAITVNVLNPVYSSVDGVLFNKSQTALIQCPARKAGSYAIANGVTDIGNNAFSGCRSLTNITIPASVTNIWNSAFGGCTSLTAITVDDLNPVYSSVDGVLFNKSQTVLILCPEGRAGSYSIPNSVISIGGSAFSFCTSLTSVVIPNSVTSIGDSAFIRCVSLASVTIGNGLTGIRAGTFSGCRSLTNITIPSSVTDIGGGAFSECTSLISVTIPNSVTSIGNFVFYSCYSLTAITVDSLNSAYSSVDGVLFNKSRTMLIQCPGGKAASYTIPDGVHNIGDWAFSRCTGLTNVTIGNGVTRIEGRAFFGCTNLSSVTIGNSVTSIGHSAFIVCSSLTAVTIPNSVTNIENYAFYLCTSLSKVTIGNGVGFIGDGAFYGCTSLTGVYFQGDAPGFGYPVDYDENNATIYYFPGTKSWDSTFSGCPTAVWSLPNPLILKPSPNFGAQTNQFGFIISWATNLSVVVEACTDLANPVWSPVGTNTLTDGSSYFSDPQWTNYASRFYRVSVP